MKILHLYSDWKWTGPAEPALQACRSLMDCGHEVLFACPEPDPSSTKNTVMWAKRLGVPVTTQFALDRYLHLGATFRDLWALPRFLRREQFDIVHCHLNHDHALGGMLARLPGTGRPAVVRSLYRREVVKASAPYRLQLTKLTDGCVAFTPSFRAAYIDRFDLDPERVVVSPMSTDLVHFSPVTKHVDMRPEFGVTPDVPLIGIVGRWQKYRKAEVFIEAAKLVLQQCPDVRFLIIGRSSQMEETVVKPIRKLGLEQQVLLAGYRGEDYVDTIANLDIFTLLMPGFDGTARAVREAMALGKPCVVSDIGMLPEIVPHEQAGLVTRANPPDLAAIWLDLIGNADKRRQLGANARRHAEQHFRIDAVGPCLETLYQRLTTG